MSNTAVRSSVEKVSPSVKARSVFSGQRSVLGWVDHECIWRGYRTDLANTFERIGNFYTGKLANSAAWLLHNQVRYVLWLKRDSIEPYDAIDAIARIKDQYEWKEFSAACRNTVGFGCGVCSEIVVTRRMPFRTGQQLKSKIEAHAGLRLAANSRTEPTADPATGKDAHQERHQALCEWAIGNPPEVPRRPISRVGENTNNLISTRETL